MPFRQTMMVSSGVARSTTNSDGRAQHGHTESTEGPGYEATWALLV